MILQRYHFVIKYEWGLPLHLADTLLPAALPKSVTAQGADFHVFGMEMESEYKTRNSRLTETTKYQPREKTSKDVMLTTLHKVLVHGWAAERVSVPILEL